MITITAPKNESKLRADMNYPADYPTIFLAGSIEEGKAENWQEKVIEKLNNSIYDGFIFNPRRVSFNKDKDMEEQVLWELHHIKIADYIFLYFDPNTKSPISLFELGILSYRGPKNVVVCCPNGFWKKENVDIVCKRYGMKLFVNIDEALESLINKIKHKENKRRCKMARSIEIQYNKEDNMFRIDDEVYTTFRPTIEEALTVYVDNEHVKNKYRYIQIILVP